MTEPTTAKPRLLRRLCQALVCLAVLALTWAVVARLTRDKGPPPSLGSTAPPMTAAWADHKLPLGAPAPDFALKTFPGGEEIRLSSLRDHTPVVLVFGSFSCDLMCRNLRGLIDMYRSYKDRARFYLVYVKEGDHAPPFTRPGGGRERLIRKGLEFFDVPFPCLVAPENSQVEKDYDTYPQRLILVDREGRIAFDAGRGVKTPWDLHDLEARLRTLPAVH